MKQIPFELTDRAGGTVNYRGHCVLKLELDFTRTFQASTKCNISRSIDTLIERLYLDLFCVFRGGELCPPHYYLPPFDFSNIPPALAKVCRRCTFCHINGKMKFSIFPTRHYRKCRFHPFHTVILPDWTLEKWALSSFTFQSFLGLISTQNKNNFWIPAKDSWGPH